MGIRKPRVGRIWFFREFFKEWSIFEIAFLILAIIAPVSIGIGFRSGVIETASTVATLVTAILFAKGKIEGYVFAFIAMPLYMIVAWRTELYGEMIIQGLVVYPLVMYGLICWIKHRDKEHNHTVVGHTSWREISIIVGSQVIMFVGYYFLLRAFDTRLLVLSSLSMCAAIIGNYLIARRCQFGPGVFIPLDIILLIMWATMVADGYVSAIVKLVMPVMFLVSDIYGVFEWRRLLRRQRLENVEVNPHEFDPTFH